jgi:hypothetical protein
LNFIIEQFQPTVKYATAASIINALSWYGANVGVWNRQKPFLDLLDETNPVAIFTYGLSDKEMKYCIQKMIRVIDINSLIGYVPDVLLFNPSVKNKAFETDCVCLANYLDVDQLNNPFLDSALSTNRAESFKLFGIAKHPKSYGAIPQALWGQALATANSVLALSEASKANAVLCNDNVRVRTNNIDAIPEMRRNYIERSNLVIAEEFLPLGTNVTDRRNQFLSEVFGCTI